MIHWKLTLAYDGTPFHGWQIQPGLPTVQGYLADAIRRAIGESVLPQGSGRTDAGVHALGQVATFPLAAPIPAERLQLALNRCLPPSIRILFAEAVPTGFHARHSALRKTYEYRIFPLRARPFDPRVADLEPESICPPTLAPYVWPCPWPLDLEALEQAARHVLGTHDFTSFAASDPDLATRNQHAEDPVGRAGITAGGVALEPLRLSPCRAITRSAWQRHDGLFVYRVTADGFLHHMVRNLVGTFVQAGAHRISPDSIPALLAARNRAAAGPTAPPQGLFLVSVEYPTLEPRISDLEAER